MALRLAVASAYPPNRRPLSEYVWHVVQSLARSVRVDEVHVLADRGEAGTPVRGRIHVHQCWSFGGIDQPFAVARAARSLGVDAVWFHTHMTSGGNTRRSQLAGIAAPAVCRLAGLPTVVTVHNMLGMTDVRLARPSARWVDVLGGHLATAMFRIPDKVCVLLSEYADLMRARYGIDARVMPLGTLGRPATVPVMAPRAGTPLLAFGRFGTYKRLEIVIDAVRGLAADGEDVRLIVAGSDSRQTPGYLADLQNRCRDLPNVQFLGYVDEPDVPALFEQSAACILPYATVTGMSSVATQAAMYGVPIIASDVPGVRLFENGGLRLNFFAWPNARSLKDTIRRVLAGPQQCAADLWHNLRCCRAQMMDDVVDEYVDMIESAIAARGGKAREASDDIPAASRLR